MTAEVESKEIELADSPRAFAEAHATREGAAREVLDAETFAVSELDGSEAAGFGTAAVAEPAVEPSAQADASAVDVAVDEDVTVEVPALTFESVAVETSAAESRATGAVESRAFATEIEEPDAAESSTSVAGNPSPAVGAEAATGGGAVYTFDAAEADAWAERRGASKHEPEEDLLAELDALEAAGAESRAGGHADARPSYVAPEFAVIDDETVAEDWSESDVDDEQTRSGKESPVVIAERAAHFDEPVGVAAVESSETTEQADDIKSVELFGGTLNGAAAETAAPSDVSSAIELYPTEAGEAELPFEQPAIVESGLAPAPEETARARGLAESHEATGLDAPRPERGLSASLDDAGDISIIPKAIQLRLESEDSRERAESVLALARLNTDEAFIQICAAFDDRADEVRAAAARALYEVSDDRAESFTRALREAPAERRRNIGAALASSGLADDAVSQLTGESRDRTYDAFSLLFLMAKAGETAPLVRAIESHPDNEVRLAVVNLLALSGQQDVLPSFRRLAVRGSLPQDVRAAVMEAIYQISSSSGNATPAAKS